MFLDKLGLKPDKEELNYKVRSDVAKWFERAQLLGTYIGRNDNMSVLADDLKQKSEELVVFFPPEMKYRPTDGTCVELQIDCARAFFKVIRAAEATVSKVQTHRV
jgi:hypothetical protein